MRFLESASGFAKQLIEFPGYVCATIVGKDFLLEGDLE